MAKNSDYFTTLDTPYQVQPPKGSAEGPLDYGKVTTIPEFNDPMGVMPENSKQRPVANTEGK
jgi:hypothetical protein